MKTYWKLVCIGLLCGGQFACSSAAYDHNSRKEYIFEGTASELQRETVPGTHKDVWQGTLHNTVQVPGALDAEGVYYRLPHETVYEIRPEKYQRAQYPKRGGSYTDKPATLQE